MASGISPEVPRTGQDQQHVKDSIDVAFKSLIKCYESVLALKADRNAFLKLQFPRHYMKPTINQSTSIIDRRVFSNAFVSCSAPFPLSVASAAIAVTNAYPYAAWTLQQASGA